MIRIHYKPIMNEERTRKVYVNGEYFTELRMIKADKLLLTDREHAYMNLAKLFKLTAKGDISFDSFHDLKITVEIS